jgi:hypothetical protein
MKLPPLHKSANDKMTHFIDHIIIILYHRQDQPKAQKYIHAGYLA